MVLSVYFYKILRSLNVLSKDVGKGNIIKVLEKVLTKEKSNESRTRSLAKDLGKLTDEVTFNVQKVGVVRFNPFKELGGDHSFSYALLDGTNTGIIITGLHTRERTRVYLKEVKKGKVDYDLSIEEKKALKIATNK